MPENTLETLCQKHLKPFSESAKIDAISLYRNDPKARATTLLAWIGEKPREIVPFGVGPVGECAQSGKGSLLEKTHTRKKYQSLITVPIYSKDGIPVGVLSAASYQSQFFKSVQICQQIEALATELVGLL